LSGLYTELKRRNVFRVAAAYLIAAWLLIQIADILIPMLGVPDWVPRLIFLLLLIGFVPTLIAAWAFELTPEGIRREREVDREKSITRETGRKLDRVIIAVLVVVIGVMVIERLYFAGSSSETAVSEATIEAPAPADGPKSIAVLPFTDLSQNRDQEWFADGLAEEILNALARVPDLLVTSRTSSFAYKGSDKDLPTIAQELGVAHVLEGSVRQVSGRIRVTAQLIRAGDGFHLWSQNYDRSSDDVIDVQEDLALKIATALETTMDPEALADMVKVGTRSVEAYRAYIRGMSAYASAGQLGPGYSNLEGYRYFEQARQLDPGFMAAHLRAAGFWIDSLSPTLFGWGQGDTSPQSARDEFNLRIDQAIASATNPVDRKAAEGIKAHGNLRLRQSIRLLDEYLGERPLDLQIWGWQSGNAYWVNDMEVYDQALAVLRQHGSTSLDAADLYLNLIYTRDPQAGADFGMATLEAHPDHRNILYQTHRTLLWAGRHDDARRLAERFEQLFPADDSLYLVQARQACADGHRDDAEALLARIRGAPQRDWFGEWLLLLLLGEKQAAEDVARQVESFGVPYMLVGWLSYPYFDARPFPSLMAVLERERVERPPPVEIPFACPPPG
jgi:TolB-like protein